MGQMSLFSAGAREPMLVDLEGLLAGPGQVVRRGESARVSVVVSTGRRADALAAEMASLGVESQTEPAEPGNVYGRTARLTERVAICKR